MTLNKLGVVVPLRACHSFAVRSNFVSIAIELEVNMKNLAETVRLSFAQRNPPTSKAAQPPTQGDDGWSHIRHIRSIKRPGKKPKQHRLDPYREQLLRRAKLPRWSCRDLAEWLYTEMRIRVSHTTVWRYLKRQPEFSVATEVGAKTTSTGDTK